MNDVEPKIPRKLAALVAAFGEKLTGEQINECLQSADRNYTEPSLTHQQRYACRVVLGDEELAAWYKYERSAGLERLRVLRIKVESAIQQMVGLERHWSDESGMRGSLAKIGDQAKRAIDHYDASVAALKAQIAEIDDAAGKS